MSHAGHFRPRFDSVEWTGSALSGPASDLHQTESLIDSADEPVHPDTYLFRVNIMPRIKVSKSRPQLPLGGAHFCVAEPVRPRVLT